jgi:hypothetical protein
MAHRFLRATPECSSGGGPPWLAADDRREERCDVEQNEVPVVLQADRAHQSGIDSRQVGPWGDGLFRDLEKVEYLPYPEPVPLASDFQDHNRALVLLPPSLLQENVAVENGEEGAPDIDQSFDRLGNPRYPGGREAWQYLPHDPCRGRANKRTDPENDGV